MSSVRSTKSKGKKAPSRAASAAKIVEEEDVNNNTQEKIVEDPIPEIKPEVNEEEETSDHQENDSAAEDAPAEVKKKKGRPAKAQKSVYSNRAKGNMAVNQVNDDNKLRAQAKLKAMTEEEKAEYLAAKAEKNRQKAERKLAQREKFAAAALEQRQKVAALEGEERAEYYKEKAKKSAQTKLRKQAGLVFPVDRTARKLRARYPSMKFTRETAVFTAAVLEYMTAELLELAGNVAEEYKKKTIKPRHIMLAARSDDEIDRVVGQNCLFEKAGRFPVGVQKCLLKNHQSRNEGEWVVDMALRKIELKEEN